MVKKSKRKVKQKNSKNSNKNSKDLSFLNSNLLHKIIFIAVLSFIILGIFIVFQFRTEGQATFRNNDFLVNVPIVLDPLPISFIDDNVNYFLSYLKEDDFFKITITNNQNIVFYAIMKSGDKTNIDFFGDGSYDVVFSVDLNNIKVYDYVSKSGISKKSSIIR